MIVDTNYMTSIITLLSLNPFCLSLRAAVMDKVLVRVQVIPGIKRCFFSVKKCQACSFQIAEAHRKGAVVMLCMCSEACVSMYSLTHLKAILELLADKIQDDGIDAGVNGGQIQSNIVQDQQGSKKCDFIY